MESNIKYTVLMTACIAPESGIQNKPGSRLKRHDPELRLLDYKNALRFWLELDSPFIKNIVFADNSGYGLDQLQELARNAGRDVEFLSLPKCQFTDHVHYGYCELDIVDKALAQSVLLKDAGYFIKATGRLRFPNLLQLLRRLPPSFDFAVDVHDYKIPFRGHSRGMPTQLLIFKTHFYRSKLTGVNKKLQPWIVSHIEDLLFLELIERKGREGAILRWPISLRIEGVSATTNGDYGSRKAKAKHAIKSMVRSIFPALWI